MSIIEIQTSTQLDSIREITALIESGAIGRDQRKAARKQQIICFIRHHYGKYGLPPSIREITVGIGLSENTYAVIGQWANELVDEGFLVRKVAGTRNLQVSKHPPRRKYFILPKTLEPG